MATVARLPADSAPPQPAGRPARYASKSIAERRRRILSEARGLIVAVGADDFTLRDLAARAGVSVSTLYNIFGDKEALIAHALRDYHAELTLDLPGCPRDLDGYLALVDHTTRLTMENAAYAIVLADLYFSRSLAPALFAVIRGFALAPFTAWIEAAAADGALRPAADLAAAAALFANLEWSSIRDWGAGRLPAAEFSRRRQRGFLAVAAGVAGPDMLAETVRLLEGLDKGR